jgi:methylmalonyl-CoA/ethylmalonyl-CoA epimerase
MTDIRQAIRLTQIGQIALTIEDMDRAIVFYRDNLGMKFLFQAPNVAFFDCGGIRLMLGKNENPEQKSNGTILYYTVDDIDGAFAALRERGAAAVREPHRIARMPDHELWLAFFRDPEGNLFGLMCEKRPLPGEDTNAQG